MSHDRGCPCGREKGEYKDCDDPMCLRKPVTKQVEKYAKIANESERSMIAKNKYVWVKASGEAKMIEDAVALWLSNEFDKDEDHIYTLGNEVEVNFSVDIKNKTVYRENKSGYRTPFENRD